ncbi:MAG: glycine-rich domain-containing protein [archaeon]
MANAQGAQSAQGAQGAQGSSEYLVLLGIILVIVLFLVAMASGVIFTPVEQITSRLDTQYWSTQTLGLSDALVDADGNAVFVLTNNSLEPVVLIGYSVNDFPETIFDGPIFQAGEEKVLFVPSIGACPASSCVYKEITFFFRPLSSDEIFNSGGADAVLKREDNLGSLSFSGASLVCVGPEGIQSCTSGGSGVDTNTQTAGWTNGLAKWLVDLNTTGVLKSDQNMICDTSACYKISDLNISSGGSSSFGADINGTNPQLILTDTDNNSVSKLVKSDVSNEMKLTNKVTVSSLTVIGGTITTSGPYTIHTFTSNGTFTVNGDLNVEILVVAGGGGGGAADQGGGGGAGGLIYMSSQIVNGAKTVVVGTGGLGGTINTKGANGNNSSFDDNVAIGGGGGSCNQQGPTGNGGSGGGAGFGKSAGTGILGQGNNGGASYAGANYGAGGGGGAGGIGANGSGSVGGNGGVGKEYSQFASVGGSPAGWFAGGGGGSIYSSGTPGVGGSGGGGNGSTGAGANAVANTGGGGGGGERASGGGVGGAGGSGVVIVRYLSQTGGTLQETQVISSKDGIATGEKGTNTFGDTSGRTVLEGKTVRFNINGTEKAQLNANGDLNFGTKIVIKQDGNLLMTSPNGTQWNCGVTNSGIFICS